MQWLRDLYGPSISATRANEIENSAVQAERASDALAGRLDSIGRNRDPFGTLVHNVRGSKFRSDISRGNA